MQNRRIRTHAHTQAHKHKRSPLLSLVAAEVCVRAKEPSDCLRGGLVHGKHTELHRPPGGPDRTPLAPNSRHYVSGLWDSGNNIIQLIVYQYQALLVGFPLPLEQALWLLDKCVIKLKCVSSIVRRGLWSKLASGTITRQHVREQTGGKGDREK